MNNEEELFQIQLKLAIEASLQLNIDENMNCQQTRSLSPTRENNNLSMLSKVRTGGNLGSSLLSRLGFNNNTKPQTQQLKVPNGSKSAALKTTNLICQPAIKHEYSYCAICQKQIAVGRIITVRDYQYHADCFRCTLCQGEIDGPVTFHRSLECESVDGVDGEEDKTKMRYPYHPTCAEKLFNPICVLCQQTIPSNTQFFKHPIFEKEIYCIYDYERQPSCFACHRKKPTFSSQEKELTELSDGRWLCSYCSATVVMNSEDLQILYQEILSFFQNDLTLSIPKEMYSIPIFAVESDVLNEQLRKQTMVGESSGHHGTGGGGGGGTIAIPTERLVKSNGNAIIANNQLPTVRGLTMSTVGEIQHFTTTQTVTTTTRYSSSTGRNSLFGNVGQTIRTTLGAPQKTWLRTEEVRDVTGVLVLYGLPHDLAASILAHETMHVYFKLNRQFPKVLVNEQVEEGICQLIAHKYLQKLSQDSTIHQTEITGTWQIEQMQRDYFMYQIVHDPSIVYGDGFRTALRCEEAIGLQELLLHISQHQTFPAV